MANNQPNHDNDPVSRALNNAYKFSLKSVLGRANTQLKSNFGAMFQGAMILFAALITLSLLLAMSFDIETPESLSAEHRLLFQLLGVLVMAPLQTGLYMMGVNSARGKKAKGIHVLAHVSSFFVLALAQLMVTLLTQLGLGLLIIPGIYFWVATVFTLPLVADQGLRPLSAIIASLKTVNKFIGPMLAVMGIMLLLFATAIVTYGLSLIWVLPFYFSVIGVIYTDIYDTGESQPESQPAGNETRFDA